MSNRPSTAGMSQSFRVTRFTQGEMQTLDDSCVLEAPLEIRLRLLSSTSQQQVKTITWMCTMRTPGNDKALVTGLLLTSGLISHLSDIADIRELLDEKTATPANIVLVTINSKMNIDLDRILRGQQANSSCGVCGQQYIDHLYQQRRDSVLSADISLQPENIKTLVDVLSQRQSLFAKTGGCHGVGLFDAQGQLIDVQEDIGRHNALDKLIGQNAKLLIDATQPFGMVISSRASFEILQKAAMLHLQFVIAIGAPSSLAIEVAKEMDMTLIAFVRNDEFNIYSGQQRLHLL
ncbi:formate dehydrogenase accessory sulfurtransferase FdhD [Alteromonadaceae bacterium BrNp21-10]|nr:formate dehydrogenase accessory sulfurtransferase FdhD [Alteromonadaceae bacterium BrNp21-10]